MLVGRYKETGFVKYLSDEEFKLIQKYVKCICSPSMRMLFKILMYLGLRVGEAVKLKRDNFSKDWTCLYYTPNKNPGMKVKCRAVPDFLRRELGKYFTNWHHRCREGYLFFPFRNVSRALHIGTGAVRMQFVRLRRYLGLEDSYYTCVDGKRMFRITPHTLRHHALWRYYQASGCDIIAARDIIGHVKIETTSEYIRGFTSLLRERSIVNKAFSA